MSVRAFCEVVQARWQAVCRSLWPPTPEDQLQAEAARLSADLAGRYQALVQRRRRVERLRGKLARQDKRISQLTLLIGAHFQKDAPESAWELALRLDALRQAAERTRGRLRKQEALYERQRRAFEKHKRTLQEVQRGLLTARLRPGK